MLMTSCVSQDLLLLKPCWLSCNILFWLRCFLMSLVILCSNILQQIAVKDTCHVLPSIIYSTVFILFLKNMYNISLFPIYWNITIINWKLEAKWYKWWYILFNELVYYQGDSSSDTFCLMSWYIIRVIALLIHFV